jgi:peroxiredoxin Q/BCP
MNRSLLAACATLLALSAATADGPISTPKIGQPAPGFKLQDQKGEWQSLENYRGKYVVLYFYPKDFTPGCTTEVCTFRDDVLKIHKAGADVLGVSLDDVKSHAEFAEKYHVPFPLLSDHDQVAAREYGVLTTQGAMTYARRETFLIDPKGKIAKHYGNVDPKENSGQVIADIEAMQNGS